MTGPNSGLEGRMTVVETRLSRLELTSEEDHLLAPRADHDIRELGGAFTPNAKLLEALRETQVEHGHKLDARGLQIEGLGRQLDVQSLQLEAQGQQLEAQGQRLDAVDRRLEEHSGLLRGLDDRVQELDDRVGRLDERVEGLDNRVGSLEAEMRRGFTTIQDGMNRVVALLERRPGK